MKPCSSDRNLITKQTAIKTVTRSSAGAARNSSHWMMLSSLMAVRFCVCVFVGGGVVHARAFVCLYVRARVRVCLCVVCVNHELQLQDLNLWNVWNR